MFSRGLVLLVLLAPACSARGLEGPSSAAASPPGSTPNERTCGPRATWADRGCAESDWARKLLDRLGFTYGRTGGSGSLVARAEGSRFFIWTRQKGRSLSALDWPKRTWTEGGVGVYGFDAPEDPLAWQTDDLTVLVQAGPEPGDVRPGGEVLRKLVRLSQRLPYRPGPGETSPWP